MAVFHIIDGITSDMGFEAEGKNLKEIAEASAKALFSIICDISKVSKNKKAVVEVNGNEPEMLLFDFLSRLVAESDINDMFFSGFDVSIDEKEGLLILKCNCYGEERSREKSGAMVKAVTLHQFKLTKENEKYLLRAYVDI
ncbi:MAG TPA: archease [Candidatus Woesearchaeota archaeon]|nr:archease [Candidatus Woesearchaeota archaeon]